MSPALVEAVRVELAAVIQRAEQAERRARRAECERTDESDAPLHAAA